MPGFDSASVSRLQAPIRGRRHMRNRQLVVGLPTHRRLDVRDRRGSVTRPMGPSIFVSGNPALDPDGFELIDEGCPLGRRYVARVAGLGVPAVQFSGDLHPLQLDVCKSTSIADDPHAQSRTAHSRP